MTTPDEKWRAYACTILEFLPSSTAPLRIDLRQPVTDAARAALGALGLGARFAVFTAENPEGANAEDAPTEAEEARRERANDRRMRVLGEALREAGVEWREVDGVAPDGGYRERCVAVPIAREEAAALAERLRQLALFWYDGSRFWLLPAAADERAEPLPR